MRAKLNSLAACFARRFVVLAAIAVLAAGCGDDSADEASAATGGGGGGGGGTTISISGTPPSQIMQGVQFSFTPTVSNPGGVVLSFSATNLPSWASINSSSGEISGTPGSGDVGVYSNIRLTVSGGGQSVTTPAYSITVVSAANGSAVLSWVAPTQRTDGSPLGTTLAGYRIYYGQSPTNLSQTIQIDNATVTTYVVDSLTPATWYFAATAFDTNGAESTYSNVASKTIL